MSASSSYDYDGEGRRVRKTGPGGATIFVYDGLGRLMAEYPAQAPADTGLKYVAKDHLGSTRMVTDGAGAVRNRYDYFPFGEEIGQNLRSANVAFPGAGYPSTVVKAVKEEFTGKERDSETGLDYLGARYFSGAMGRFTSADSKAFSRRTLLNPQKWNQYSYVLNNPLAAIDPDGNEEVWLTIRAFIPQESFRFMGATWKRDNRGFSNAPNASSRVQGRILIETDASVRANPIVRTETPTSSGSRVTVLGRTFEATERPQWGSVSGTRDSSGNAVVNASLAGNDPLVPGSPAARANLTFSVDPRATQAQVSGSITQYPAFEVLAQPAGGGVTPLFQYMPTGSLDSPATLLDNNLLGPMRIAPAPVSLRTQDCERTHSCGQRR